MYYYEIRIPQLTFAIVIIVFWIQFACTYRNTSLFRQGVTLDLDYLVLNSCVFLFVDEQILFELL